ncbi:MAG: Holliday junction branch migration protein RuvA [Bacteroidales bacterium]
MYDYIKGQLIEIIPTEAVVENNGMGYKLQISLQTFTQIQSLKETKLYIYHHIREDIELWYGFFEKEERNIFTMLIEVSGIGPNTARMMLSSMSTTEIRNAIVTADVNKIKSIKGIGIKTAQRVIIDLKDKMAKGGGTAIDSIIAGAGIANMDEALSALVMLGFNKVAADKVLRLIIKENPNYTIEELIKFSLKRL